MKRLTKNGDLCDIDWSKKFRSPKILSKMGAMVSATIIHAIDDFLAKR